MKYPYLVTRAIPGFYLNTEISFVLEERLLSGGTGLTVFCRNEVYDSEGIITDECRKALRAIAKRFSHKTKFRFCVVYSPTDCDYVEPDGSIDVSTEPPRSTMQFAEGKCETEFITRDGSIDAVIKPIKEEPDDELQNKQKNSSGLSNFHSFLFLIISIFLVGCGSEGFQPNTDANSHSDRTETSQCIPSEDANLHIGKEACVKGKVVSLVYLPHVKGNPTFISFDRSYPNQSFTVVIWNDVREKLKDLEVLKNSELIVNGIISKYRGQSQIIVDDPGQISFPQIVRSEDNPGPKKKKKNGQPKGATARCKDGWISYSRHRRGTCSHHGGVAVWF